MLTLGKAGSAGTGPGVLPVCRDGDLVATLHAVFLLWVELLIRRRAAASVAAATAGSAGAAG